MIALRAKFIDRLALQILQLGGPLVVGRSNFLIHERVETGPNAVRAPQDRGKMLLARFIHRA